MRSEKRATLTALLAALAAAACIASAGCATRAQRSELPDYQLSVDSSATPLEPESRTADEAEARDYDPWEALNERVFWFNHDLVDRFVMKPAATAWRRTIPDPVTQALTNAFDNLEAPKRFVNNVLQFRLQGAFRELTRFTVNSTVGVAGMFDVAAMAGVRKSSADCGQTLGSYGIGPGPYLVLPLMQPLTVRDGIGYAFDVMLDPVGYFAPFVANLGRSITKRVHQRAVNLELYEDAEDATLDLYAAVRNGYLQRRAKSVSRAIRDREREREAEWSALHDALFGRHAAPVDAAENLTRM